MKPLPKQFVEIWWLKPAWAFGGITTLVAILTALIPAQMFEQNWNTPKYFNQSTLLYIAASVICFVVGTFVTKSLTQPHRADQSETWDAQIPWGTALLLFRISSLLCLFGYLCWAASAISRGVTLRLLIDAMTGARGATYELRDNYLITISGITTMTQFGISAIVLGLPIGFARGWRRSLSLLPRFSDYPCSAPSSTANAWQPLS